MPVALYGNGAGECLPRGRLLLASSAARRRRQRRRVAEEGAVEPLPLVAVRPPQYACSGAATGTR
jgi:hypothetical protein